MNIISKAQSNLQQQSSCNFNQALQYIKMNNLKKAFAKFNTNTSRPSKIEVSTFKKKPNWDDLQIAIEAIDTKNIHNHTQNKLEQLFIKIIQSNFSNGDLHQVEKLYRGLADKYKMTLDIKHDNCADEILKILKKMVDRQSSNILKKYLQISIDKIEKLGQSKKRQQKQKCLKDYNQYMQSIKAANSSINNSGFNQKEINKKSELNHKEVANVQSQKLLHSTSAINLKIRTRKDEEGQLERKKSLDAKYENSRSINKLQHLLKDNYVKPLHSNSKKQYDFSAIFQASKSNIQSRNKTFQTKEVKKQSTKMTKNKKDEAFIFYRPNQKKKI